MRAERLVSTSIPLWQQELARGYGCLDALLADLGLDRASCGVSIQAAGLFPLRVPRNFVALMRRGDPADPLLRQVLPRVDELVATPGYAADPVGDLASVRAPGLLQKYAGRALLIATGACAIHCRYCFRRSFPYADNSITPATQAGALAMLEADTAVSEVILSGGDPLVLHDARLGALLHQLDRMPHVRRIRIHTRVPVVLPERVDDSLLSTLAGLTTPLVIVVHCNHPNEIGPPGAAAFRRLRKVTAALLNQSVLLRGVNDSAATIAGLSEALFAADVLPYYMHQLDAVAGAAHFAISDYEARVLMTDVAARLPGYLVPRLVRETPGAAAKQSVDSLRAT